jgi:hypothetical protein
MQTTPQDRELAVVDQLLAAKAFPNESAIGKRILIRVRKLEPEWVEIIGVAAHMRGTSLATPGREQIYLTDGYVNHGTSQPLGASRQWRPIPARRLLSAPLSRSTIPTWC